jgi:REP element-mobilizing transposase RayT
VVIAHHLILTGYGHWLPNDPRGSLSSEIRAGKLVPLGDIHFGRKEVQPPRAELEAFQQQARPLLEHPALWFDAAKRQAIAKGFAEVVRARGYTCFACAILSNHAHMVIRRHRDKAEAMILELKKTAAGRLRRLADVPSEHPIWSGDPYKKFLSTPEDVERAIRYVEANPAEAGLEQQRFEFVGPYQGEWDGRR